MDIVDRLIALSDAPFRDFNAKLIPNIDKSTVIGIKTPVLRKFARSLILGGEAEEFMSMLPHDYFEENQLHAFIISELRDPGRALTELERFLPYIDNWATCDQLVLKSIAKHPESVLDRIDIWLQSDHTYTLRFAIGMLMRYFLDARFDAVYPSRVADIHSDEYYVKMMQSWYFATALAKQYAAILPYLAEHRLDRWVHNKTIRKAIESFRVTDEHKSELRRLVIK